MASSKQKEGATTLREKTSSSSSSTVSSTGRSPSSRSSLLTSPNRRPEKPTVPSRGLTAVTASTAVAKPPSTRRPTERNAPAATALKERAAVLKAPPSSSKAAASHKQLTEKPSASASSKSRTSHTTSSVAVRGRSPGAVVKRKEAKSGSLSRTSSDPGLLEFAALSLLGNNKIEESTETTVTISSMEDHSPNELILPNPVEVANAAEDAPPPPHECNKQQHEQSPLESEGVAHDDGSRSINEEMIKEDNIEIAHNTTLLEDPKGGGGDEVGNYEEEKLIMVEVMKKNAETMHGGGKKEAVKSNDVIEETRSKLLVRKKSKVKALVGAFETVMSLHGSEAQTDQTQEKGGGEMD